MSTMVNLAEKRYVFRGIKEDEAYQAAQIEEVCFSREEACTLEMIQNRMAYAMDMFLAAQDIYTGRIAGYITGIATDQENFLDAFFFDGSLHEKTGSNVMILGLEVLPEYRGQGIAKELMRRYAMMQKEQGRKKMILTCSYDKVRMYEKMGFEDLGISASKWGNAEWHEMVLSLFEKQ